MPLYELFVLAVPHLKRAQIHQIIKRSCLTVMDKGGVVTDITSNDVTQLAYTIKKVHGHYDEVRAYFRALHMSRLLCTVLCYFTWLLMLWITKHVMNPECVEVEPKLAKVTVNTNHIQVTICMKWPTRRCEVESHQISIKYQSNMHTLSISADAGSQCIGCVPATAN